MRSARRSDPGAVGASPGASSGAPPEVEVKNGQTGAGPVGAVSDEGGGALEAVVWLESTHGGFGSGERGEPPGGRRGAGKDSEVVSLILRSPSDGFRHAVVWREEKDEVWSGSLAPGARGRGPGWVEERVAGFGGGFGGRGEEAGASRARGGCEEVDGESERGGLGEAMCQAVQRWGGRVRVRMVKPQRVAG